MFVNKAEDTLDIYRFGWSNTVKSLLIMEGQISILHPTTCGFGKVIAYELNSSNISLKNRIAELYETIFGEQKENFSVASETHRRNFPKIVEKIRAIGKRHKDIKKEIKNTIR